MPQVRLAPIEDELLERLLAVAVADAEPAEVMPPTGLGPDWSPEQRDEFRAFHRDRYDGLDGPHRTVMYAILADDAVIGMIRLSHWDEPGTMETGMWLGRSSRGKGLSTAALTALAAEALRTGAAAIVADTTPGNTAAVGALRRWGARLRESGGKVFAEVPLRPDDQPG